MPSFLSPLVKEPARRYSLANTRTERPLATDVEAAFDSATRNQGLLGRTSFAPGGALILAPCTAVHTWFMRFPIDLLFVNRAGEVTKVKHRVGAWRMAAAWHAFAVVELPAGAAADCRRGDSLKLVPTT